LIRPTAALYTPCIDYGAQIEISGDGVDEVPDDDDDDGPTMETADVESMPLLE
jgi:hypothetical protein